MNSRCSYSCSNPPKAIEPNPDISGIGVLISFVITANIAVIILLGYYLLAFKPEADPFQRDGEGSGLAKPNPVDEIVLSTISHCMRKVPGSRYISHRITRSQPMLEKCVLKISDLHVVTGIAILVSGYGSLQCGISAYHWQILIYLAWFSCTTHLCALTFLRNYLYDHPEERFWRLVAMFVVLCMLIVGIVPTTGFENGDKGFRYNENAICFFQNIQVGDATVSVVFSVAVLVFSFITRVVKLHKTISESVVGRLRAKVEKYCQQKLRNMGQNKTESGHAARFLGLLFYKPALALFLIGSLLLDFWTSMLSEIYWLLVSIAWGTHRLVTTRAVLPAVNHEENGWGFGQILPLVLLLGPLMTIFECLYPVKNIQDQDELATPEDRLSSLGAPETNLPTLSGHSANLHENDLERDYYHDVIWFKLLILMVFASISVETFVVIRGGFDKRSLESLWALLLFCVPFLTFVIYVVSTYTLEGYIRGRRFEWLAYLLLCLFSCGLVTAFVRAYGKVSGRALITQVIV